MDDADEDEASTEWLCSTSSTRAKLLLLLLLRLSRPAGILEGASGVNTVVKDIETRAYKKP
jgi:hypothetical protein